uniref:Efflux RND transporter periplasmic adaptor subunit n=1 Tax=Coralloluteibacterium stylophorae TaxID=1776034 RepID=A0A8J8AX61_9GAMM
MTDLPGAEPRPRPGAPAPRSRRRQLVLGMVLVLALALVGWLVVRFTGGEAGGRFQRPSSTVTVVAAATADVPVELEALGTVTPTATATVRPQVSGVVTRVAYEEGQTVRQGDLLVQIDPRPFEIALAQARGSLQQSESQLADARVSLERFQQLLGQDSIARQEVDTQAATVRQLEGAVASARAAVRDAELDLDFASVEAPIDGVVGLRTVDVGNYVAAGDATGVAVITRTTPIDVAFAIPQDRVADVRARAGLTALDEEGNDADRALPVIALDRTRSQALASGRFLAMDNQISTDTGTVGAKARFDNADGALFPNQFVNVRLRLQTLEDAVTVPLTALRQNDDGAFVYVVNADSTVTLTPVVAGVSDDSRVVVAEGLAAGTEVVTEGGARLVDGAMVMRAGQVPPMAAPAGDESPQRRRGRPPGGGPRG